MTTPRSTGESTFVLSQEQAIAESVLEAANILEYSNAQSPIFKKALLVKLLDSSITFAGYNPVVDAMDVNLVNPPNLSRFGPFMVIDGVTNVIASEYVILTEYNNAYIQVITEGADVDLDISIEANIFGAYYSVEEFETIQYNKPSGTATVTSYRYPDNLFDNLRVVIPRHNTGTVTAIIVAGNN